MFVRGCLCFLLVAFSTSAAVQEKDDFEKEKKKLEGSWKVIGAQVNGIKLPLEAFKKVVITFKDEKVVFKDSDKIYDEIEIDIDPAAKPKEIDYRYLIGLKKGVREQGIYALDGDQLTIVTSQQKQKRPAELVSKKGTGQQLLILKRIKS